jgi:hypothetical protein
MNIEELLRRVAEGYEALIEVADLAGIHIRSIASGMTETHVEFVTVDNVHFTIDMRPIADSEHPTRTAIEAMRASYNAARQPTSSMN